MSNVSRRGFLAGAPIAGIGAFSLAGLLTSPSRADENVTSTPATMSAPPNFPSQNPALVQEVVGLSHRDLAGVKKLVDRQPALAKASWDWGFGDWETALGAASHVGNREIARYLMEQGARPDIFTFAMLGDLATVTAMVAGSPGVQRIPGPHGITLLQHAIAGGDASKPVVEFLRTLGDADNGHVSQPLSDDERQKYFGAYVFGAGADDLVEVKAVRKFVTIERPGGSPRNLVALGNHAFHPVGAPAVRILFTIENDRATRVEFYDPDLMLTAIRKAN